MAMRKHFMKSTCRRPTGMGCDAKRRRGSFAWWCQRRIQDYENLIPAYIEFSVCEPWSRSDPRHRCGEPESEYRQLRRDDPAARQPGSANRQPGAANSTDGRSAQATGKHGEHQGPGWIPGIQIGSEPAAEDQDVGGERGSRGRTGFPWRYA